MPPSGRRGSVVGSLKASTNVKGTNRSFKGTNRYNNEAAKWHVTEYKPPRRVSDEEIAAARKMFFELDRDMSGSIDADEITFMLRSMGQNPTEREVHELIASVDGEDGEEGDGKIQLREFIKLYTGGLDSKSLGSKKDVDDVFLAVNAKVADSVDAKPSGSAVPDQDVITKAHLSELLSSSFDLDVDMDDLFNAKSDQVSKDEMTTFLLGSQTS